MHLPSLHSYSWIISLDSSPPEPSFYLPKQNTKSNAHLSTHRTHHIRLIEIRENRISSSIQYYFKLLSRRRNRSENLPKKTIFQLYQSDDPKNKNPALSFDSRSPRLPLLPDDNNSNTTISSGLLIPLKFFFSSCVRSSECGYLRPKMDGGRFFTRAVFPVRESERKMEVRRKSL